MIVGGCSYCTSTTTVYGKQQPTIIATVHYSSVTHPREAEATFLMYLKSVPLVALSGGAIHFALLVSRSCEVRLTLMVFFSASITISSPSSTRAMGPPTY